MLVSLPCVTMWTLNHRLVVALAVSAALALGFMAARAVSGPEKEVVPVIQLHRGQLPPAPAPAPDSQPALEPETTAPAVEPLQPTVGPTQPPATGALPPGPSSPGPVAGDDDDDSQSGDDDDDGDGGGDDD